MEEELKGKMDEKQTCEMEKEIDRMKGKVKDKPKHESNKGQTQQRKKNQFPIPPSKRRTRQNTSYHHGADVDPNNPLPF